MKSITARAIFLIFFLYLLIGFVATESWAGEYYIYRNSQGGLVISNQKPPPGSKIIKQLTLSDEANNETPQGQADSEARPNGNANSAAPTPSR